RRLLRLGPAGGMGAQPRARAADPRRAPLLVAARLRPALGAARARLPRRRLRRLVLPRARVHLREPAVLLVLRARAAPLGPLPRPRPEPRRDRDERRADTRLPARDRLVRLAPPARRDGSAHTSREIAALVASVGACFSRSTSTTT